MAETFDFVPNSHVAEEIAPEEVSVVSFNGWEFAPKSPVPYRRKFQLTLSGVRWYLSGGALDVTTDPTANAGRLLDFYKRHRRSQVFNYQHEYLGLISCRFADAVNIPRALPNSKGLVPDFGIMLVHHNPGY